MQLNFRLTKLHMVICNRLKAIPETLLVEQVSRVRKFQSELLNNWKVLAKLRSLTSLFIN